MLLLSPLSFNAASAVWLALSLAALVWLAAKLLRAATPEHPHRPSVVGVATLTGVLLLWPPVLHNLEKGQWSILLAAMVASAWRSTSSGSGGVRPGRAGLWIGAAASLKVMPATVLPFFIARHRAAAWTALAALVVISAATLPLTGASPWLIFVEQSSANVAALETWYANTASLHGLLARLFVGGPFARPLVHSPTLGRALQLTTDGALLAVAAIATWRAKRGTPGERPLFALWATLAVLLNPLAWAHTAVLLALPFAILFGGDERPRRRALLAAALVLLSIPKETLYRLAGPPPSSGLSALFLSLHALGALILFVVAAQCTGYRCSGTEGGGRSERSGFPARGAV
jgi:hypothetical protein